MSPHDQAVAYVDAHPEQAARWGRDTWAAAIEQHLTPAPDPGNVPWRSRQRRRATLPVGQLADRVLAHLQPPAGTRPQPVCPWTCWVTHQDDEAVA